MNYHKEANDHHDNNHDDQHDDHHDDHHDEPPRYKKNMLPQQNMLLAISMLEHILKF